MTTETQTIASADGVPLRLRRVQGAVAAGPVVLLGHGPSVHSGLLAGPLAAFAQSAAAVWAGDLRGHGGSVSARAPFAHLDPRQGWDQLLADMAAFARQAFGEVPRERRILVGGGFSGHLMLELLARAPDLARHLVMAAPMPPQPGVARLGTAFLKLRALARAIDRPDPQLTHHVYGFLRAQLPPGTTSIGTISADPAVVQAVQDDPRGFPTPTPGYWSAVFPGMSSTWDRIAPGDLPADLRVLILSGPDDPQTRGGRLVPRVIDWFAARGVPDARALHLDGVRANVLIDAPRLPVVPGVMDWFRAAPAPSHPDAPPAPAPAGATADEPALAAYLPALEALGVGTPGRLPPVPVLIDLCYAALDDETRWIELLYRLSLAAESEGQDIDPVVAMLHPHWQRAFELREELRQAAALGRLYHDLIDRLDLGVAVLDAEGALRHHNPAYARALARMDGGAARGAAWAQDWTRRLLGGSGAAGAGDLPLTHAGQVVGISFVPASLRGGSGGAGPDEAALGRLVVLRLSDDAMQDVTHRAGLLSLAYGLTGQEGVAALHLAQGLSTEAIGRAMRISEHTVRSHLKQAFDKMGVNSRTELAARVLSGPLGWLVATAEGRLAAAPPAAEG